jgi:hypothetical protein
VALIAALPSLPLAAASDPAPTSTPTSAPAKPSTIQAAVRAAAVRDAAVVAAPRAKGPTGTTSITSAKRAARANQSGPDKQSGSFFRSGAGALALAVLAVGGGYAIYSASHDKINSPAKQ